MTPACLSHSTGTEYLPEQAGRQAGRQAEAKASVCVHVGVRE
jgi:hypothetical protein